MCLVSTAQPVSLIYPDGVVLLAKDATEPIPLAEMNAGILQSLFYCTQEERWVSAISGPVPLQASLQDTDAEAHS